MRSIIAIFFVSAWHVLLPGHVKTLLLAGRISGMGRKELLIIASGYGISHGAIMGSAICAGIVFSDLVGGISHWHSLILGNSYILILFLMSLYFAHLAFITAGGKTQTNDKCLCEGKEEKVFTQKRSFTSGMALGVLPCSGTIGLVVIGPAIFQTMGKGYVISAFIASWFGVFVTVLTLSFLFGLVPTDKIKKYLPGWIPFAGAAALCLIVALWRGFVLWEDLHYLF